MHILDRKFLPFFMIYSKSVPRYPIDSMAQLVLIMCFVINWPWIYYLEARIAHVFIAVQSWKPWVSQRTIHNGWLGGPCYVWMVRIYDVVWNDNQALISLFTYVICCLFSTSTEKAWDWYFKFSNHFAIWQTVWHKCCQATCNISRPLEYLRHNFAALRLHRIRPWYVLQLNE